MLIHNVLSHRSHRRLQVTEQLVTHIKDRIKFIYILKHMFFFCTVSLLTFKIHVLKVLSSAYDTKLYHLEMLST